MTFPTEIFNTMEQSIIHELTELLEGGYFTADAKKLNRQYLRNSTYRRNKKVSEDVYKAAIIQGIDKSFSNENHPVNKIWCSKKDHNAIGRIERKEGEYKSKLNSERLAKNYDIAWQTGGGNKPNWFCQIKILTHGEGAVHKKSAQALGDLFWAAVDSKYLEVFQNRNANFIFVWIEGNSLDKRDTGKFLRFNKDNSEMKLIFAPGYHRDLGGTPKGGFGQLRYQNLGEKNSDGSRNRDSETWSNKSTCTVTPNNRTAIKEILAAGTNGTFFRMFNQPGSLYITTRFRQHHTENWSIYVHRLLPNITLRGATSVEKSKFGGGKLFNWIP